MAETLFITGPIQHQPHELCCDALGMSGSAPLMGWVRSSLGGMYDYEQVKAGGLAFCRLFDVAPQLLLYTDDTTGAPRPQIDRITPESLVSGGADVTLHVYGRSFTPRSQILFNGGLEPTVFVSPTALTTIVSGATATTPGQYPVAVLTAAPGGGQSAGRWFYILDQAARTVRRVQGPDTWELPLAALQGDALWRNL